MLKRLISLICIFASLVSNAKSDPDSSFKRECVGRAQIELPAEIEVAAETVKSWDANKQTGAVFEDEQAAGWSGAFFGGPIKVTHALASDTQVTFFNKKQSAIDRFRPGGSLEEIRGPQPFNELFVAPQHGIAWDYRDDEYARRFVILNLRHHMIGVTYSNSAELKESTDKYYWTLINGLRPRPLFDVPHEPGVCLPYAFIRDDGSTPRSIGMTYRLNSHPDVTIWLEDTNAAAGGPHVRAETLTARYRAKFFWEQRYNNAKRVESEWTPGYRRTTIDGRDAIETFVKLVRYENNIEDYGYLAVVRGDPDAAEDTPDLMLYVIRDAANATKRGLTPIGRDELLDLARRIAASIRRRPVGRRKSSDLS